MKRLIIIILAVMGGSFATLSAQNTPADASACSMAREGDTFNVGLNLNLSTTDVKSNRMVVFTPILWEKRTP